MRINWNPYVGVLRIEGEYQFYEDFCGQCVGLQRLNNISFDKYTGLEILCSVYRPLWEILQGTPNSTNNHLLLPIGNIQPQEIETYTAPTANYWYFRFQYAVIPTNLDTFFRFIFGDANNYLALANDIPGNALTVHEQQGGAPTTLVTIGTAIVDADEHIVIVWRDSDGRWHASLDGGATIDGVISAFTPDHYSYNILHTADQICYAELLYSKAL